MDEPIIVRMSGKNSSLTTTFSPVINVHGSSEIALVSLQSTYIFSNQGCVLINETNNRMQILMTNNNLDIKFSNGYYTIHDINTYICNIAAKHKLDKNEEIFIFNLVSMGDKCRINCNYGINFDVENSLASTLGFEKKIYHGFWVGNLYLYYHQSEKIKYKINGTSSIKVMCNIANGSLDNGQQSHSIYEFFPRQEIAESPNNLIYYKLKTAVIKKIKIDLVDEENNPIKNFDGQVTIILHIRPIKS